MTGSLRLTQRLTSEGFRAFAVPLVCLIVGFALSRVYTRGVIFPNDRLVPLPIFVPEAVILSVLLLTPTRRWWIYLAVYYVMRVVERVIVVDTPLGYALVNDTINVLQPLIGAGLVRRFVPSLRFDSLRTVGLFIACITMGELIGSLLGASGRAIGQGAPFWPAWRGWFVGNLVAGLLLTPTLVLWITVDRRYLQACFRRRWVEGLALTGGLLLVSWLIFGIQPLGPDGAPQLVYLSVPFLLWAAVRFGPLGITTALSLFAALAIAGAANQLGPFVGLTVVASVFQVQLFLLAIGVPLFCLAVLVEERTHSEGRYRAVVSNLPGGAVFLFGPDLKHLFADGEGLAQLGVTKMGVEGRTPAELFRPELAASLEHPYRAALAGRHESFELTHAGHSYRTDVLPVADNGAPIGLALLQDITDQRRAERQGAAMERERLARELHDSVSQALFAANTTAEALAQLWEADPGAAQMALADLRRMTNAAQTEMRGLLFELRPEALTRVPLDELLGTLAASVSGRTGVEVVAQLENAPVFQEDLQLAFYRVAQEALTNITKHAGARRIEMRFQVGRDSADGVTELTLEIADDGCGFDVDDAPRGGLGLGSMHERADAIDARLAVLSRSGEGTRVRLHWVGMSPDGFRNATSTMER